MRLAAQRRLYELTRGRSREREGVVRRVGGARQGEQIDKSFER